VAGLAALGSARPGAWWLPLDGGGIGRGWERGVNRVLAEALVKVCDLVLELLQPPLVLLDEGQNHRLGVGRDSVPKGGKQWRQRLHAAGLGTGDE
jgi:hypothetical protein